MRKAGKPSLSVSVIAPWATSMIDSRIARALARKANRIGDNLALHLAHGIHRARNRGKYRHIIEIVKRYRSGEGALANPSQAYKLYELNELLHKFRPCSILELGSGSSTCMFARYVKGSSSRLTSVDESEEWLEHTRDIVEQTVGEIANVQFIHADKAVNRSSSPRSTAYEWSFTGEFDLVYVDGPSLRIDGVRDKQVINYDIVEMLLSGHRPKAILVDVRRATAIYLAEHFFDLYDFELSHLFDNRVKLNYQYHSILVLKGGSDSD